MNTPTPRTDDAQWGTGKVTTDFARTLERELAHEREKVWTLRNAMKYLLNNDNYIDPQFDPCALASKAFEVTGDAK